MDEFDLYEQKLNLIFDSRGGLEDYHDRETSISLIIGILIKNRKKNDLSKEDVCNFLDIVLTHKFKFVYNEIVHVKNCLSKELQQHPVLTEYLGHKLLQHKLVNTQLGPGEFFFTFFDIDTTLGIAPNLDYDIRREINGKKERIENKSSYSSFVKKEVLETILNKRDSLLVIKFTNKPTAVKPFSNAKYKMCKVENIHEQLNYNGKGLKF